MVDAAPDLIILTLTSLILRRASRLLADPQPRFPAPGAAPRHRREIQKDILIRALDLGVNDYLLRPIDRNELIARVTTQFRWKTYSDRLRETYRQSLELAATDPLTGLNNRRYLSNHLGRQITRAKETRKACSILMVDVDHFKRINDTYGHPAGDEVLKALSERLKFNIRGIDLACRYGGEEFVIVMPEADMATAEKVAERLRESIAERTFELGNNRGLITVTASIGVASLEAGDVNASSLIERADKALYAAKAAGRNKVVTQAA